MDIARSKLFDRVLGSLAGLMAGDSIGQRCRGLTWQQISQRLGPVEGFGPWQDAAGHTRAPGEAGEAAKLVISAAGTAADQGLCIGASEILAAAERLQPVESLLLQVALQRVAMRPAGAVQGVVDLPGVEPLYIGALIGAFSAGDPELAFLRTAAACAGLAAGSSLEAGQTLAAALAVALSLEATPATVLDAALDFSPTGVARTLQRAVAFARERPAHPLALITPAIQTQLADAGEGDGSPVEAVCVALISFYVSDANPVAAVTGAAAYGGASHASAAAAGALCGALRGEANIGGEWLTAVEAANRDARLRDVAKGLCKFIVTDSERQLRRVEGQKALASSPTQ